jgi:large subunit ribosomal protein L17
MLRNMATSLFEHERIKTTLSKGKAVKPLIDKLVTLAKRGDLHAVRQVAAVLTKETVVKKLFDMAQSRFGSRTCGYTLMVKQGLRKGDVSPMVYLKLVTADDIKVKTGGLKSRAQVRSRRVDASRQERVSRSAPLAEKTATEPTPDLSKTDTDDNSQS